MKKISKIIAKNFFASLDYIKKSRKFIYIISGIFILFVLIGLIFPAPDFLKQQILEVLRQIVEKTAGLDFFELAGFIFLNNFAVSAIGIISGVFFGIFPIITGILNGYILGYIFRSFIEKMGFLDGGSYFWRILPHGIFELPAIMISLGIGLKLGCSLLLCMNKNSFLDFKKDFRNSLKVLFFVILPLLIIAAIIEASLVKILR